MYIYIMLKNLLIVSLCCVSFFTGTKTSKSQNITFEKQILKQPPYLKVGDTVAIVAPSGILKNRQGEIEHAKALLKTLGVTHHSW